MCVENGVLDLVCYAPLDFMHLGPTVTVEKQKDSNKTQNEQLDLEFWATDRCVPFLATDFDHFMKYSLDFNMLETVLNSLNAQFCSCHLDSAVRKPRPVGNSAKDY